MAKIDAVLDQDEEVNYKKLANVIMRRTLVKVDDDE